MKINPPKQGGRCKFGVIFGEDLTLKENNCLNIKQLSKHVVVLPGFEPGLAEPKSDVLPLHHRTILMCFVKSSAKVG